MTGATLPGSSDSFDAVDSVASPRRPSHSTPLQSPISKSGNDGAQVDALLRALEHERAAGEQAATRLDELIAERDQLQEKVRVQERDLDEYKQLADEYRHVKDECDELRTRDTQAKRAIAERDALQLRLQENTDLKREYRVLKQKNDEYMKAAIDLDDERRKCAALMQQLDAQRRQAHDAKQECDRAVR